MARAPLRAGDPGRIGHYRLTARLGSGGMGVVYLGIGWDGTQVAVKVLRPELADDPEFRHRFQRTKWQPAGTITHDLSGVSAVQAASGPHGYVITGTVAEPGGAQASQQFVVRSLPSG